MISKRQEYITITLSLQTCFPMDAVNKLIWQGNQKNVYWQGNTISISMGTGKTLIDVFLSLQTKKSCQIAKFLSKNKSVQFYGN